MCLQARQLRWVLPLISLSETSHCSCVIYQHTESDVFHSKQSVRRQAEATDWSLSSKTGTGAPHPVSPTPTGCTSKVPDTLPMGCSGASQPRAHAQFINFDL